MLGWNHQAAQQTFYADSTFTEFGLCDHTASSLEPLSHVKECGCSRSVHSQGLSGRRVIPNTEGVIRVRMELVDGNAVDAAY